MNKLRQLIREIIEAELKELQFDPNLRYGAGAFGDEEKAALENSLTGLARDMVIDGSLFAEYGNVTYDEANLKDGADPEEIEAIDQIKAAVTNMGGRVVYGDSDGEGLLKYIYLVDRTGLKVITKEEMRGYSLSEDETY